MSEVVSLDEDADSVTDIENELEVINLQIEELKCRRDVLRSKLSVLRNSSCSSTPSPPMCVWNDSGYSWDHAVREAAEEYFGIASFRPHQLSVINAIMSGSDAVMVAPTGSGKSLVYQLPAILMGTKATATKRLTVVVSPLLSLMHDQVASLIAVGVKARLLSSQKSRQEQTTIRKELKDMSVDILFVTPERIAKSTQFMNLLGRLHESKGIGLIAVDEAHCISQWGHDFRQDYLKLGMLRKHFPGVPIVATTATATPQVVDDICGRLALDRSRTSIKRAPGDRPNIYYKVLLKPRVEEKAMELLIDTVTKLSSTSRCGIVYCLSRRETEDVCARLKQAGIPSVWYHGDLGTDSRAAVHKSWVSGESEVIVATVAFGMGVHHDGVRWVIHYSLPPTLQHYQQESGRCGRDGRPAISILMASPFDVCRQSVMVYWKPNALAELYALAQYAFSNNECRRRFLSAHMGDSVVPSCDSYCDVCQFENSGEPLAKRAKSGTDGKSIADVIFNQLEKASQKDEKMTLLKLSEKCRKVLHCGVEDIAVVVVCLLRAGCLMETFNATAYSVYSYVTFKVRGRRSVPSTIWSPKSGDLGNCLTRVFGNATCSEGNGGGKHGMMYMKLDATRRKIASSIDEDLPPQKILTDREIDKLVECDASSDALNAVRCALAVPKRFELYGRQIADCLAQR